MSGTTASTTQTATQQPAQSPETTTTGPADQQATTDEGKTLTQAEVNALLAKQKREHRAELDTVTAKAKKFDEIEAANRTEAEKFAARITELESENTTLRGEKLRATVAAANGITDPEDIAMFLTGTDEETLTAQAKRLAERTAGSTTRTAPIATREGHTKRPGTDARRGFVRTLTGNQD